MPFPYRTNQDDVVDLIVHRVYHGDAPSGTVELVYELNRDLSTFGPFLAEGMTIMLPDILPRPQVPESASLWTGGGLPGIS